MPTAYLDLAGVAERTGLAHQTVRQLRTNGRLPAPDITLGARQHPGWLPGTIDTWWTQRERMQAFGKAMAAAGPEYWAEFAEWNGTGRDRQPPPSAGDGGPVA